MTGGSIVTAEHDTTSHPTPTMNGRPIDEIPASIDAAKEEQNALLGQLRDLDVQLGNMFVERKGQRLSALEYNEWKRRAMHVRKLTERRYRFVKQWTREENARRHPISQREDDYGMAATSQARRLARRISAMEAIAVSAAAFARDQTPEHLANLVQRVDEHATQAGV